MKSRKYTDTNSKRRPPYQHDAVYEPKMNKSGSVPNSIFWKLGVLPAPMGFRTDIIAGFDLSQKQIRGQ